jgi:ABC-2 type transport system ATP-binding protein
MHDMEILFLDEPTVGLDAIARRRILRYLKDRARQGLSIVFTTHILHEADALCDRIAVLHLGRLIALDSAERLKQKHGGAREISVSFLSPPTPELRAELTRALAVRGAVPLEGPDTAAGNGKLEFEATAAEELLPWISSWAQAHGLVIERMSVEAATLEGAFLGMIEGTNGNGESPEEVEGPQRPTNPTEETGDRP